MPIGNTQESMEIKNQSQNLLNYLLPRVNQHSFLNADTNSEFISFKMQHKTTDRHMECREEHYVQAQHGR